MLPYVGVDGTVHEALQILGPPSRLHPHVGRARTLAFRYGVTWSARFVRRGDVLSTGSLIIPHRTQPIGLGDEVLYKEGRIAAALDKIDVSAVPLPPTTTEHAAICVATRRRMRGGFTRGPEL